MRIHSVLSEKIKYYRKLYGMTQDEFAGALGVESLHISNVERGKKGVSLSMLVLICERFNISMEDLVPVKRENMEMKKRWIDEIVTTLEALEASQVGMLKTMICGLKTEDQRAVHTVSN